MENQDIKQQYTHESITALLLMNSGHGRGPKVSDEAVSLSVLSYSNCLFKHLPLTLLLLFYLFQPCVLSASFVRNCGGNHPNQR